MTITKERRAELLWLGLSDCATIDKKTAVLTVSEWLQHHGASFPDVSLFPEQVRRDAMFWADLASPDELAAYFLASALKLKETEMTTKQTKITIAECFRRLSDDDKAAFINWAGAQV
jgi:hypothetical protein